MGITMELQDKAWAVLPKEFREEVRGTYKSEYVSDRGYQPTRTMESLARLFGEHNLISDAEPEEDEANTGSLSQNPTENCDNGNLISNGCKAEPRFLVGDKVLISDDGCIAEAFRGRVGTVVYINSTDQRTVDVGGGITPDCFHVSHLAPYHEQKPKEDTEGLNLCEMLKGHEGEEFFSPCYGKVTLDRIPGKNLIDILYRMPDMPASCVTLSKDGTFVGLGDCSLFPSRALYEKHPLDAKRAWAEWQKPKIELLVSYTIRNGVVNGCGDFEPLKFKSDEEARQAVEAVRKILEEFHKRKKL